MAQATTKQVQTLVNRAGKKAASIRADIADLKALRAKFMAANPPVTGTPLAGGVAAALSSGIDTLDTEISKAVWTGLIAAIVPSHSEDAL